MEAKVEEKKLNKKELAAALGMSSTTLWRCLNYAKKTAKKLKIEKLPSHSYYSGGRKYYYLSEVQNWLIKVYENSKI